MAETYLDAGIDYILGVIPKGDALGTLALAAFTSQTEDTVAARTATIGSGIDEPAGGTGGYARVAIDEGDWGAPATNGSGRRITAAQQAFPESTGAWNPSTVNGFLIAVGTSVGGNPPIYQANFDQEVAAEIGSSGIVLRVTPFWQLNV